MFKLDKIVISFSDEVKTKIPQDDRDYVEARLRTMVADQVKHDLAQVLAVLPLDTGSFCWINPIEGERYLTGYFKGIRAVYCAYHQLFHVALVVGTELEAATTLQNLTAGETVVRMI